MIEENIFDSMFKKAEKKETKVEEKPVTEVKEEPKQVKAANDKTKSYLYRLTPEFFNEVMCFSKLTGESINTIVEKALNSYLENDENNETYAIAKEMAKRLNKKK